MITPRSELRHLTRPQVLAALETPGSAAALEVERLARDYAALFAREARPTGPIPPSVAVPPPDTALGMVALERAGARLAAARNALCRHTEDAVAARDGSGIR